MPNSKFENQLARANPFRIAPSELRSAVQDAVCSNLKKQTRHDDIRLVSLSLAVVLAVAIGFAVLFSVKSNQIRKQFRASAQLVDLPATTDSFRLQDPLSPNTDTD